MPVIDLNAVHLEDRAYLVDKVPSACLDTVVLLHLPDVVGLETVDVDGALMLIEGPKVDALDYEVRLLSVLLLAVDQCALVDPVHRAHKHLRKERLREREHEDFLVLKVI